MNDAAQRLGLRSGMPLADARAMYPALAVAESDEAADRRLLESIADWCDRYTPLVGLDAPDGLVLDIAGCAHLFGGEAAMCRDIVARLAAAGFAARIAVADTVGCACAVARYAHPPLEGEGRIAAGGPGWGGSASTNSGLVGYTKRSVRTVPDSTNGAHASLCAPYAAPQTRPGWEDEQKHRFAGTWSVVPAGAMRQVLAPLPVAALRLAPEIVEALDQLGLKRIADLLDLPRAPLAARFGEELVRRLDQAFGREDEPITPRLPVPSYVAEQRFPDPIGLERDVLGTIARLAGQLGVAMERRLDGARLLQVALFRTDNTIYRIEVGTAAPVRDADRIVRLFADRLAMIGDACDPGFGFDMVRLAALVAERSDPVQLGTAGLAGFADPAGTDEELSHLIDRLGARFGLRRVTRLVAQDTHIPEFAVAAVPASERRKSEDRRRTSGESRRRIEDERQRAARWRDGRQRADGGQQTSLIPPPLAGESREGAASPGSASEEAPSPILPRKRGRGKDAWGKDAWGKDAALRREEAQRQEKEEQDTLCPARPVRLFGRPEPVDAVAEVPDGPPARFRWRRVLHEVATAEGPERIAMEWWRDEAGHALTRDYFRIESRDGLRAWLYREGLYGGETATPRWFLHGLFG